MYSQHELVRIDTKGRKAPLFMEYIVALGKLRVVKRVVSARYWNNTIAVIIPNIGLVTDYVYILVPRLDKSKRRNIVE